MLKPEYFSIHRILSFLFLILSLSAFAQKINPPNILNIDTELLQQANAVVVDQTIEVNLINQSKMTVKERELIWVRNESASILGKAYLHYDKSMKVNHLSVVYYDIFGNELKKIKKNKFTDASAISNSTLYADDRVYIYYNTPLTYPYIRVLEYEYETNSTLFMPHWKPVSDYGVSVASSIYTVTNPENIELTRLTENFEAYGVVIEESESKISFSVQNIKAIESEDYSLGLDEIVPYLRISPSKFSCEGIAGEFDDWESVGKWIFDELLTGQDVLPEEAKIDVNELVAGVPDKRDRLRLIYEYMQNRSRYVSVQIGIGGWKPFSAELVHKYGYGDCKALANYTMSLLKTVGIPSYYTIVYRGRKIRDIDKDFISLQGNHAILCVPMENDTIWLECTSNDAPCGYIANSTDDRDVFVVFPNGGEIMHTKKYEDSIHLERTIGICQIMEDNSIDIDATITNEGLYYGRSKFLLNKKEDEVEKYYKNEWGLLADMKLTKYSFSDHKDAEILKEKITLRAPGYIKSMGNYMILRPFVLLDNNNYRINSTLVKKREFSLLSSKTIVKEFVITLPDIYAYDELPETIEVSYAFGRYITRIEKIDSQKISYYREFSLTKGIYPKEEYENYVKLLQLVKKNDALNILINKL